MRWRGVVVAVTLVAACGSGGAGGDSVCAGVAGGTPCNDEGVSDFPPVCCEPGTQCCAVGFEWDDCRPADAPCPTLCGWSGTCPADQWCVMEELGSPLGSGCLETNTACSDACPPELQCGATECCGWNTVCNGGCCELRSSVPGRVYVTEVRVAGHSELGSGAAVRVMFEHEAPPTAYDDDWFCRVWVYDVFAGQRPTGRDEGEVSLAGTASSVPACRFDEAIGRYRCVAAAGATAAGDVIVVAGGGEADVTIAGAAFEAGHVGMYLEIAGADDGAADGAYPIVAVPSTTTVRVARSPLVADTWWSVVGSYAVVAGLGPTPAAVPFLEGEATISVTKLAGSYYPAFTEDLGAGGVGLRLSVDSAIPSAIPLDGSAVSFTCSGAGGDCGPSGSTSVVEIRTTNALVDGLPFDAMPAPTSGSVAVARCWKPGTEVTVPAEAMEILLATSPTRLEARYGRVSRAEPSDPIGAYRTEVFVGHEIVGYTTP